MGQARDFAASNRAGRNHADTARPAASIEVASAEALRLLQQVYFARPAVCGASGSRSSRRRGSPEDPRLDDDTIGSAVAEHPEHVELLRGTMGLALAMPLVILGPWLGSIFSSLAASLATDAGLVQAGAVESSVSRGAQASVLRLGGFLVTGGFFALAFKLLLAAPCTWFGSAGPCIRRAADSG